MNLKSFHIKNFRRLKDVHIELDPEASIFVGANNSGKTSATHVFQLFLGASRDRFSIHDFSASCWKQFDLLGTQCWGQFTQSEPIQFDEDLPSIILDLWFDVQDDDLYRVIDLLPNLDWKNVPIGVRLEFAAKDPAELMKDFCEAKRESRRSEKAQQDGVDNYQPWPEKLTDYLMKRLNDEYVIQYYVLDYAQFDDNFHQKDTYTPLQLGVDQARSGAQVLKTLLKVDFLNAQRHLSDISSPGRAEDLSKRLSRFYERNLQRCDDDFEALRALSNSENHLNAHLSEVFEPTLRSLNQLGYPGFANPHLVIKSALNPESIMNQNTKVYYALRDPDQPAQDMVLPDKYNGLGFKNLIYMVIELLDFHARWVEEEEERPPLHLIMIEEPEAHLHAQLQQVFIRKILDILRENEPETDFFTSQLVITTHSPHIIYESGFKPIRYFRRSVNAGPSQASDVLNLSDFYGKTEKETRDFLQQYMKLTHCDLFFADAVILVEGNVERLLLPLMIDKSAKQLKSSYLSILEVGGAFAHCFKELVEFLGLPTLVITDLDSVHPVEPSPVIEDEKDSEVSEDTSITPGAKACHTGQEGAVTSNQTLIKWLPQLERISDLLEASDETKIQNPGAHTPAVIRVAYQTRQRVCWGEEAESLAGRTFEEAFALENLQWCQTIDCRDLGLRVASNTSSTLSEIRDKLFKRVNISSFKKTRFALGLMTKNTDDWKVPAYIEEGLLWLCQQITVDNDSTPAQTDKQSEVVL